MACLSIVEGGPICYQSEISVVSELKPMPAEYCLPNRKMVEPIRVLPTVSPTDLSFPHCMYFSQLLGVDCFPEVRGCWIKHASTACGFNFMDQMKPKWGWTNTRRMVARAKQHSFHSWPLHLQRRTSLLLTRDTWNLLVRSGLLPEQPSSSVWSRQFIYETGVVTQGKVSLPDPNRRVSGDQNGQIEIE